MGNVYKSVLAGGVTPTSITPSNLSPVSLTNGESYEMLDDGYAISSYDNVTPTTDGIYFSTGMKNMSQPGWAYSQKPTPIETLLWTNPSSSSTSFSAGTISLSDSMSNYDLIKILYIVESRSEAEKVLYVKPDEIGTSGTDTNIRTISGYYGSRKMARVFYKASDTSLYFFTAEQIRKEYGQTYGLVPTAVYGVKL